MAITASMVKELREMTGAGMMDCKKALTATDGDMDKAVEFLREKGLAAAEKKAGRIAAEGIVDTCVSDDNKVASIVEVNSETDFVAKNDTFKEYVAKVAAQAPLLGRILGMVPRNDKTRIRFAHRCSYLRSYTRFLQRPVASAAPLHALHHRRALAVTLRP